MVFEDDHLFSEEDSIFKDNLHVQLNMYTLLIVSSCKHVQEKEKNNNLAIFLKMLFT